MDRAARRAVGQAGAELVRARYDSLYYAEAYATLLQALITDPRALPAPVLTDSRAVGVGLPSSAG